MKRYPTRALALIAATLLLLSGQTVQAKNNWLRNDSAKTRKHYRAVQHQDTLPGDPFKDDPAPKSSVKKKEKAATPEEIKFYEEEPEEFEEMEEYAESCGECPLRVLRRGTFFGGAEYLYTRTTSSEAVSHVEFSLNGANRTDNRVEYNFGFEAGLRAFIGYEMCDCGGSILFTYTTLSGNSTMNCGPATATSNCAGHLEINTDTTGETLTSTAMVNMNIYDLDFAKTIPLMSCGGCGSCDGCSDCGDECGACCPLWDMTLYGGVRLVDYDLNYGSQVFDASSVAAEYGNINTEFNGAGPRVGAQIRRYFGPCANVALYARGNIGLMVGDYETVSTRVTTNTQVQRANLTRTIPVTEIELGATWNVTGGAFVSAGYMFQAWHDLGLSQTIGGNLPGYDDANILSFDGMFVRGEWRF